MLDLVLPNTLGAAAAPDGAAWQAYLQGLITRLERVETKTHIDYAALKAVREKLGLPFVVDQGGGEGGGGDPGAWSSDYEAQALDIMGTSAFARQLLQDAIDGKRRLLYQSPKNDFAIEGLDSDIVRVDVDSAGYVRLVDVKTGNVAHVQGTLSAPVMEYLAVAGVTLAFPALGAVALVVKMVDSVDGLMVEKTTRTLAKRSFDLVQSGQATPAEAKAMTDSILLGQKALQEEKAKASDASGLAKLSTTVTTLGYLGLAGLVIYGIFQFIPRRTALARLENKRPRELADEEAAHQLELYISSDRRFSMSSPDGVGHHVREQMLTKWKRGKYDHSLAPKGWRYVVDAAAKEFKREQPDAPHFSPATRDIVAVSMAEEFLAKVQSGETWA